MKKKSVSRISFVRVKKGIEYAKVQMSGTIAEGQIDTGCLVFEHEDVATRLTETFMLCPYNQGKAADFKHNLN